MTIDKFKRVLWRLKEIKTIQPGVYSHKQIRLAIMEEIGTDERTVSTTIKKMSELGMLKKGTFGCMRANHEHTH